MEIVGKGVRTLVVPENDRLHREPAKGGELDHATPNLCEVLVEAQSNMGEGLLVVEDRRIRYANEAFCSITGRSVAELGALATLSELVVPEQRPVVEDLARRHLSGEAVEDRHETTPRDHNTGNFTINYSG
jgi:PAS domain-containing protein